MSDDYTSSDSIEASDLAYHLYLLQQMKIAADVQAAYRQWEAYLVSRYGLSRGDELRTDGSIVRKS